MCRFLLEESKTKRKKKKRKKRQSDLSVSSSFKEDSDGEVPSARTSDQLPALRGLPPKHMSSYSGQGSTDCVDSVRLSTHEPEVGNEPKSVLVHDHEYHHPDMHVHFRGTPEMNLSQIPSREADDNLW